MRTLIRGGTVITMNPTGDVFTGDVLVEGDRIAAIGSLGEIGAARVIEAQSAHDEESVYYSAMLGIAELLRSGTSAIIDVETDGAACNNNLDPFQEMRPVSRIVYAARSTDGTMTMVDGRILMQDASSEPWNSPG